MEATVHRRVADAVEPRLQAISTLLRAAAEGMPGQEQLAAGMEWEHLELPTPEDAKLVRDYAAALLAEEECKTRLDQITGLHQAIDLAGDAAADIAVIQPSMSAERFRALAEKQMALMSNLPADPFAGMGEGEKSNYETNMALARRIPEEHI